LAKGDIIRLIYILSYSPGGSTRCEVGPDGAFWTQILGKGKS